MGSEKTRSVNYAQTLSLLIHSLGQMLGAVRMGVFAPPRYRIGRREKYAIFFLNCVTSVIKIAKYKKVGLFFLLYCH